MSSTASSEIGARTSKYVSTYRGGAAEHCSHKYIKHRDVSGQSAQTVPRHPDVLNTALLGCIKSVAYCSTGVTSGREGF